MIAGLWKCRHVSGSEASTLSHHQFDTYPRTPERHHRLGRKWWAALPSLEMLSTLRLMWLLEARIETLLVFGTHILGANRPSHASAKRYEQERNPKLG